MTPAEIRNVIADFAEAAARVCEAGADGVEITAEKGYLIHQFLNPGMNRRRDEWGGSVDKRFRLLQEIICAVRQKVGPDFLVGVRMAAADFNYLPIASFMFRFPWVLPWRHHVFGNDIQTTLSYGKKLKELGVDLLHVVTGNGFPGPKGNPGAFPLEEVKLFYNATRHLSSKASLRATILNLVPRVIARPLLNVGWRRTEGVSLAEAAKFKCEVGLPVITNGGYQSRAGIEAALEKCDFVSMARALIATPNLVERYRAGEPSPGQGQACTFCNRCCARTATSPLGCYEPERFISPREMIAQIMAFNTPDP
jgi:2,4-dienoyl-CoA reductase (NADPH2)